MSATGSHHALGKPLGAGDAVGGEGSQATRAGGNRARCCRCSARAKGLSNPLCPGSSGLSLGAAARPQALLTAGCPLSPLHSWHQGRARPPLSPGAEGEHGETGTEARGRAEASSALARVRWASLLGGVVSASPAPRHLRATSAEHVQKLLRWQRGSAELLHPTKQALPLDSLLGSPMRVFLCHSVPCQLIWG